jgi:hypothetical protein
MSDKLIPQFIGEVKVALAEIAQDSMQFPKRDPFEHGTQCGRYQGLNLALEILESVVREDIEKEKRS